MNAGITPGVWSAIAWQGSAPTTIVADHQGQRVVVAECTGNGRYAEESLADARLLAAAKDLHDAADAALLCIFDLSPTQARVEVVQLLQAALTKADGKEL